MGLAPLFAAAALAGGCPAAPVQYGVNPVSARDLVPWISAGRASAGIVGLLYAPYGETLGDRRVREAPVAVLHARQTYKLGWMPRRWRGTGEYLVVEGRRADGAAAFRGRYRPALSPQFFPTDVTIPTAGCWRLTLRTGALRRTLHALAVEPPAQPRCDTTAVRSGPDPVDPTF